MIEVYDSGILERAEKQRKKILFVYYVILIAYILLSALFVTWEVLLPYQSKLESLVKWLHHLVTAIFVTASFLFFGIPFRRIHKYVQVCRNFRDGLKDTSEGVVIGFSEEMTEKDGVDVKSIIIDEKIKYREGSIQKNIFILYEE